MVVYRYNLGWNPGCVYGFAPDEVLDMFFVHLPAETGSFFMSKAGLWGASPFTVPF